MAGATAVRAFFRRAFQNAGADALPLLAFTLSQLFKLHGPGHVLTLDQYNEKLITPEMKAKIDAAKADIIAGKIVVHDYMSNNACK